MQVLLKLMIELQHEKLREIVGAKIEEQHEVEATKIPVIPSWIQVRPSPLPSFERTRRPPGPAMPVPRPLVPPESPFPLSHIISRLRARAVGHR